ncbi:hypothetical protein VTP01DRAFT_4086 [Rhizomucor pusillus]|uniref:uncharacterized protein n=1 Tax=Rhizomucor pusillus TaxID=4840 RepID=UPI003744646B
MKSLRCSYRNGHFDDQYSFELEGFMTKQEFAATINSFNSIARSNPPPPPLSSGRLLLFVFCICSCLLSATLLAMHYTHHGSLILAAPLLILFLLVAIHGWRRKLKAKFERSILHMCSCMNATENVRGINFRFIKESPSSCSSDPSMSPCSYYD